ncbi:MAG: hypothetical protein HKN17_08320 [Rhodothermales bacterium]|nr:hypothetical protein [Rhodothermales bacterium]
MSRVQIAPVSSGRDLKAFIQFPYDLYRDSEWWVPPLRMDVSRLLSRRKNAFFEHGDMQLFLARDASGHVAGRIAAIRNGMHLKKYADGTGFFGFFECIDHRETAHALFDAAASWLRSEGLHTMRGPANPSLNDTAGLLVHGFDRRPSLLMPYNPPEYVDFLESYGFERSMTMWAYFVHKKYMKGEKLKRGAGLVLRRWDTLSVRTLDMDRFDEEARTILDIYNEAWSENWGHVPMTDAEFAQLASELKQIVDPDMVVIVEDGGVPVAFAVSLPDVNVALREIPNGRLLPTGLFKLLYLLKSDVIQHIRMPLMGVRKAWHGRGLDALLINESIQNGIPKGLTSCELSWVLDSNRRLINALESLGAVVDKEYALFDTAI